jgi:predicted metal-binding transcription factor (methanogenesis marker protein 9)
VGSLVAVCRHTQPCVGRDLVRVGAAAVAVGVVFRIRRFAAAVVESSQADRERGLG